MASDPKYSSTLAPHIESLVASKRARGYSWAVDAQNLGILDRFCVESGFGGDTVTRELVEAWMDSRPQDSAGRRARLLSDTRQLSLHIRSLGGEAYVPTHLPRRERAVAYVPTEDEARSFFAVLDAYGGGGYPLIADGHRIAFRLMYCCGLRISECASMARADADLASGTLYVRHSKGDKDRVVYMADDLTGAVAAYWDGLVRAMGKEPPWLFPGADPSKHVHKATYDSVFARLWALVPGASEHAKHPTPHSLRHAFVVRRINSWKAQGVDVHQMMPYLSAYLGHSGPDETLYYYHQTEESANAVRSHGESASRVIPEPRHG